MLEQFRNARRLFERGERWLSLEEKPLECVLSVYTNSETAIARVANEKPAKKRRIREQKGEGVPQNGCKPF